MVERLSVAQRQIIAIARAVSTAARILIFDERHLRLPIAKRGFSLR